MIVGIAGLAGSGKDTAADFLVKDHGFAKIAFADPMKRFCREIFDFTEEQLWGASEHRNSPDPRYPREVERAVQVAPGARGIGGFVKVTEFLTPRYALQTLGTEYGRNCFPSIWVDYALRVAKRLDGKRARYSAMRGDFEVLGADPLCGVVISDCRFMNEIDAIRRAGGKTIRIVRPGAGLGGAAGVHPSEKEMSEVPDDAFDLVIENTGTLERFRALIAEGVKRLGG
jgi:hypothetical protein